MSTNQEIGLRIKEARTEKKYTLKQLSEETGLSIGYLSQFERGLTQIALDTLQNICQVLEVKFSSLFQPREAIGQNSNVTRSYERSCTVISPQIIQYTLSQNVADFDLLPRVYDLMPFDTKPEESENPELYRHEGEEFIYVLEGTLTMDVEDQEYTLFPGDSIQVHSEQFHNWKNKTNQVTKILAVNIPNPFKIK